MAAESSAPSSDSLGGAAEQQRRRSEKQCIEWRCEGRRVVVADLLAWRTSADSPSESNYAQPHNNRNKADHSEAIECQRRRLQQQSRAGLIDPAYTTALAMAG